MRHLVLRPLFVAALFLTLLVGGAANADKLLFTGSHSLQFTNLGQIRATATGTGVATTNGSSSALHLSTLQLSKHFATLNTVIPVTDPIVTAGGIVEVRLTSLRINPQMQGGIFAPISGALQNTANQLTVATMPSIGSVRICLFYAGCNSGSLDQQVNQTTTSGAATGNGIGGVLTIGGSGAIRISILGAPWTVKTVTLSNRTANANLTYFQENGFAHGPASLTSSTAQASGVIQLVNANQTTVVGVPGNSDLSGNIGILRLHFAPEPGILLLLGSGAVGMALLGRSRNRK